MNTQGAMSVLKPFLIGIAGAVLVGAIVAVSYLVYDTHRMAKRGDAAAAFIEQQLRNAQAQQQAPAKQ